MSAQIWQNVKIWLDKYDRSGDMNACALKYGAEVLDITRFGADTRQRLGGLKVATIQLDGLWNGGVGNVDDSIFQNIDVANIPLTICPQNGNVGDAVYFMKALVASYAPGAKVGQVFAFQVQAENAGSNLVRGTLMVNSTQVATGNSAVQSLTAVGSTQNLYGSLHCFAASGTTPSLTAKIRSAPLVGFGTPTDRIVFNAVTAPASQFAAPVAGPITDAFWRVDWTITGTTPSFTFVVVLGIQ